MPSDPASFDTRDDRLTIDLSDDVARDLEQQARDAGKSPEAYATGILAATGSARERLEQMLLEGLDSGPGKPFVKTAHTSA